MGASDLSVSGESAERNPAISEDSMSNFDSDSCSQPFSRSRSTNRFLCYLWYVSVEFTFHSLHFLQLCHIRYSV